MRAKKADLAAQLKALDNLDIETLLAERERTAAHLADLDGKIAQVRAQVGSPVKEAVRSHPSVNSNGHPRSRLSGEEIRSRITKSLGEEKSGLSQLQISERTAISYGTVAAYLKANASAFKTTGVLKNKRYFLK